MSGKAKDDERGRVGKTNAMRALEQRRIPFESFSYSPERHSAEEVAALIGAPPDVVFKTLVVLRDRGRPMLAIVPGNRELDLRLLARGIGEKAVRMASQREAEELTGLQVGGISALALLGRGFDVYLDRSALAFERVYVSAGRRGINLRLRVADLVAVTAATAVDATTSDQERGEPAEREREQR